MSSPSLRAVLIAALVALVACVAPQSASAQEVEPDTVITYAPTSPAPIGVYIDGWLDFGWMDMNGVEASAQYRFDDGPWTDVPVEMMGSFSIMTYYLGLDAGEHTFEVASISASGVRDSTPAKVSFTLVSHLSARSTLTGPSGEVSGNTLTYQVSRDGGDTSECRVDGGAWAYCEDVFEVTVPDGPHVIETRAYQYPAVGPVSRTNVVVGLPLRATRSRPATTPPCRPRSAPSSPSPSTTSPA